MSFKSVMVIKAAVCLVFGLLLLSVPGVVFGILGAELSPGGQFAAREYAAAMLGILMLAWFARNATHSRERWAIVLMLFVYDAIGFLVSLFGVLSGILNSLGWFIVVIYAFFTLAFGLLLRVKTTDS